LIKICLILVALSSLSHALSIASNTATSLIWSDSSKADKSLNLHSPKISAYLSKPVSSQLSLTSSHHSAVFQFSHPPSITSTSTFLQSSKTTVALSPESSTASSTSADAISNGAGIGSAHLLSSAKAGSGPATPANITVAYLQRNAFA